jgi:hypothetical protein
VRIESGRVRSHCARPTQCNSPSVCRLRWHSQPTCPSGPVISIRIAFVHSSGSGLGLHWMPASASQRCHGCRRSTGPPTSGLECCAQIVVGAMGLARQYRKVRKGRGSVAAACAALRHGGELRALRKLKYVFALRPALGRRYLALEIPACLFLPNMKLNCGSDRLARLRSSQVAGCARAP